MWEVFSCVRKKRYYNLDYFRGYDKAKNISKRHGGRVELQFIKDGYFEAVIVFYNGKCIEKYKECEYKGKVVY